MPANGRALSNAATLTLTQLVARASAHAIADCVGLLRA